MREKRKDTVLLLRICEILDNLISLLPYDFW